MSGIKKCFLIVSFSTLIYSCSFTVDSEYIKDREWLDDRGRMIGFYNKIYDIKNDTIFNNKTNEPRYQIKSLNKYFNSLNLKDLKTNKTYEFMSTEEYSK
jgi:hypothetical protein